MTGQRRGKSDGFIKAMSQCHTLAKCLTDMWLFAVQLPSLPEAVQEEDTPAVEEEANEEQAGEWLQGKTLLLCQCAYPARQHLSVVLGVCVDNKAVMINLFCP